MFWLGLIIAALSFLAEFSPLADWLTARWPRIKKWYFHLAAILFFCLGSALTVNEHVNQTREAEELRRSVVSLRTAVRHVNAQVKVGVTALWSDGRGPTGMLTQPFPGAD